MDAVQYSTKPAWAREITEMILLVLVSAIFVYFLSPAITRIYFALLLVLAFRSEKPYFWIAFMFILINEPAGLFRGSTADDLQRVPLFTFGKGASIAVYDIFFVGYIIKALTKIRQPVFFRSSLNVLTFFAVVLFFYSFIAGTSIKTMIIIIRSFVLPFTFFLVAHRLINNKEDFERLIKLLLPFILLALLGQIHEIYFGTYITTYVKHGEKVIAGTGVGLSDDAEAVSRAFDSDLLATILFILGGYLLISNTKNFKRLWVVIVMYIDFFICFTSATRGIFITYSIIVINLFYFLSKSSLLRARQITSMFVIMLVALGGLQLLKQNDVLSKQLNNATERLSSIGNYLDQNSSVSDRENKRVDERIPKLMKHIKESPIIGFGFTDKALEYADGHVGFHNQMIEGGILEVLVFLYFIFSVIMKVRRFTTGFRYGIQKNALRFFAYALLALLVVHGTSSQFFGFNIGFLPMQRWFMFTIFFVGLNVYYQDLKNIMNYDYLKQKKEKAMPLASA